MFKLALAAFALAGHAHADSLAFEARGTQLCARQVCLERIPLGRGGLDLTDQMSRYNASFTETFEPKVPGARVSYAELLAVAGATGLSPASRERLSKDFARLTIRDLAANVAEVATMTKAEATPSSPTMEIVFFAQIDWLDHASRTGTTSLKGRLVIPRDRPVEVNKSFDEINRDLSALVHIDEVSADAPTRAQLIDYVAPATMSNLILALLTPPKNLAGSNLETLGRYIQGDESAQ